LVAIAIGARLAEAAAFLRIGTEISQAIGAANRRQVA